MIKLEFCFEASFSKVILGIAGKSATICEFHYFTSKKINPKGLLENNSVINDKESKKDNKVSNIFLIKSSTKDKVSRNKLVKPAKLKMI